MSALIPTGKVVGRSLKSWVGELMSTRQAPRVHRPSRSVRIPMIEIDVVQNGVSEPIKPDTL